MVQSAVVPMTIRRANGGWLAVAPPGARFKIGTTGETEQEAVDLFQIAWREWTETLDGRQGDLESKGTDVRSGLGTQ